MDNQQSMEKKIAIIASLDTKEAEVIFLKAMIERLGHTTFIIDVGARGSSEIVPDIAARDVARASGKNWPDLFQIPKHEMVEALAGGLKKILPSLFVEGRINAAMSIGGVQNTTMAAEAMKMLPVGFPKLIVSTVASGNRIFAPLVGTKDIVLIPAVADISGINRVTSTILSNAAAAIIGMVQYAGIALKPSSEMIVGATLMGVTNDGVVGAVRHLEKAGYQVISFHTTGVGGRAMDEFISSGFIKAVMDLCLHEITAEFFPGSFSHGAFNRLQAACEKGIPMVVAPGGVDFIDFSVGSVPFDLRDRKYVFHNSGIYHIKVFKDEIIQAGNLIVERLNCATGPVSMLIPKNGFRQYAAPGGKLYDPEIDQTLVDLLKRGLKTSIKIIEVEANFNEPAFSLAAAEEMKRILADYTLQVEVED